MRNRLLLPGLAVALSAAFLPSVAEAQEPGFQIGPVLAFHDDFDFGIGGVVVFPLESLAPSISFMGDVVYFFTGIDNVNYLEINPNLIWDFPLDDSPVLPFALGGLNIARISVDVDTSALDDIIPGFSFDGSSTEIGLNAGGGIKFGEKKNFIAGAKVELSGGEGLVLFGMVPFSLGGG